MADERLTDEDLARLEHVYNDAPVTHYTCAHCHAVNRIASDVGRDALRPVPRLVAEVRASRELLAKLEWAGGDEESLCPACDAVAKYEIGDGTFRHLVGLHEPGCALARLLGREP